MPVWSPHHRKVVIKIERVEKRFTQKLLILEGLSYQETLDRLGLYFLEGRKSSGDMIEVYNTRWISRYITLEGMDSG